MKCAYKLSNLESLSSINKTVLAADESEANFPGPEMDVDFYRVVGGVVVRKTEAEIAAIIAAREAEAAKAGKDAVVQQHIDATARAKGYDSALSCCSYAGEVNTYQTEAQRFISWRARCWTAAYEIFAGAQAGTRPVPTDAELIAAMPVMNWNV